MRDSRAVEWPQIDVMRGTACAMMVINHAAYTWVGTDLQHHAAVGVMAFVGSFAPAVFFLVSAIGIGLRGGPSRDIQRVLYKAAVLIVGDHLLRGLWGGWIGLNFLGFIAVSMIVLEALARCRRRNVIAAALACSILALRFIAGPAVKHHLPPGTVRTVSECVLGTVASPGVAYPPCPWLIYSLVGFVIGSCLHRRPDWLRKNPGRFYLCAAAVTVLGGITSYAMVARGWPMFRWTTVSIAFVVASGSCLAAVSMLAVAICASSRLGRPAKWLSLRGISSLAVVPVHYLLIGIAASWIPSIEHYYFVILATLMPTVFTISRHLEALANRVASFQPLYKAMTAIAAIIAVACSLMVLIFTDPLDRWERMAASVAGQVALCFLLVVTPWTVRRPARTTHAAATTTDIPAKVLEPVEAMG